METKFIKGTNQQYSIREDGQVIRHYKNNYDINQKKVVVICKDEILNVNTRNAVFINHKHITVPKLLRKTFGFTYCNRCNDKIHNNSVGRRSRNTCDKCLARNQDDYYRKQYLKHRVLNPITLLSEEERISNIRKSKQKWVKNNPDKVREKYFRNNKIRTENLPRYEVAYRLGLTTSELTDEIYNLYKKTVLLKRRVVKENNLHISTFNN